MEAESLSGSPARRVYGKMVYLLCQYEWLNLVGTYQSWRLLIVQGNITQGSQERENPTPSPTCINLPV